MYGINYQLIVYMLVRARHWLCARWPACIFKVVGPVRATTINFMLARGASGFQIGG